MTEWSIGSLGVAVALLAIWAGASFRNHEQRLRAIFSWSHNHVVRNDGDRLVLDSLGARVAKLDARCRELEAALARKDTDAEAP